MGLSSYRTYDRIYMVSALKLKILINGHPFKSSNGLCSTHYDIDNEHILILNLAIF